MPDPADTNIVDLRERIRVADKAGHVALVTLLSREYLLLKPQSWIAWHDLGSALWPMAHYAEALKALRQARKYCPKNHRHYVEAAFGHLYKRWGKYKLAARWYQKMIDATPDDATGYIFRGAALARLGSLREAEAMHRAATACSEGCIDEAYLNLGLVLRAQERSGEAAESFRKALELTPDYQEALNGLADVEHVLANLDAE